MSGKQEVIGMLHAPVNTILAAPDAWRRQMGVKSLTQRDREILGRFACWTPETLHDSKLQDEVEDALAGLKQTSFFDALCERMFEESKIYVENGIRTMMLENVGAPYFRLSSCAQPGVFAVMTLLARQLRREYGKDYRLGLQILAFSDPMAMSSACFNGLDFIRSESALYEGERPEGRNRNEGNLAQLYFQRDEETMRQGNEKAPLVYVDFQKKHTVFAEALQSLDVWIDNIIFQKVEGVIITGTGTGVPVTEADLEKVRSAIDAIKGQSFFPKDLELPLISGSGITAENAAMYKRYVDAAIVGSTLKQGGYWECRVDADRVARFMEAWNR